MIESSEFLGEGAVPFAMRACERLASLPVTGCYDAKSRMWKGDIAGATATVTSTRFGQDGDID